ncbi:MAG: valine--tRNA ligase [Oscillospiraceae bacterium]|nr:valine--tRNA ligase [Oscillospiraceae bacterium]
MSQLEKNYSPRDFEDRIYKYWTDSGFFAPDTDSGKIPYTIVIPPPNITGQLHMGHALNNTLQDIIIRTKRMQGYAALWLPGTDHASIATEAKIVEAMKKEGLTKEDVGRENFLERAWAWNEKYGSRIVEQLKKLGCSCDWSRLRFTLDEGCSKAVDKVFVDLYEKGLVYRGERIINWCPYCRTSISDAEVEYGEKDGHFWHINYPLADGGGHLSLATTRPETMLGDTAVAVNPNDDRYKQYIGRTVILPIVNREIPIIADDYVDTEFGTGVVKITPAHDPNDFFVGQRHNLPVINIMTEDGRINQNGGEFEGLDRYEARDRIVELLKEEGFLTKTEEHRHNVGECYRCSTVVEPRVSLQWFVKMEPLAKPAIQAVKDGEIKFIPDRYSKTYFNWMENIKDWCISRQLWWGHRIPAYHCDDCGDITVSLTTPDACKCGGLLRQDEDTLDTWFSSALWPFSTLGWPENTRDLEYFYPTNVLVTAYEIIFFWVARMIFSGLYNMNKIPFDTVLIHGLVRDEIGRKMSKSLGNGSDPIDVINNYGADALRFMVTIGLSPGSDTRENSEKINAGRLFANKLWNSARFVLMNVEQDTKPEIPCTLTLEDRWILTKYNNLIAEMTANIDKYELGLGLQKIYDFIWDVFCDWYIEIVKPRLWSGGEGADSVKSLLLYILSGSLKLLHPYMPYITEELWQSLPGREGSIMVSPWPEYNAQYIYDSAADFENVIEAVRAIRNIRNEMNIPVSKKAVLYVETKQRQIFDECASVFVKLAGASEVVTGDSFDISGAVIIPTANARLLIPAGELVDTKKETERLTKERDACQKDIDFISGKLSNQSFIAKAPEKIINAEKEKLAKAQERMANIMLGIADTIDS